MRIVLFFQATTRKSWFQKLSGIHRFAQEHDWFVQVVERYSTATDVRRTLKNWAPAGCLVDRAMSNGRAPDAFFRGIPTVYLDQNPETGADELYHARGIIRESEENAAALFGTGRTVYSAARSWRGPPGR